MKFIILTLPNGDPAFCNTAEIAYFRTCDHPGIDGSTIHYVGGGTVTVTEEVEEVRALILDVDPLQNSFTEKPKKPAISMEWVPGLLDEVND